MDGSLPGHFKTGRAARALSLATGLPAPIARAVVIASLSRIWLWGMELKMGEDGLIRCDERDMVEAIGFAESSEVGSAVIAALVGAGFLESVGHGYVTHDWRDWQTKAATANDERKRDGARERQRRRRIRKRIQAAELSDAEMVALRESRRDGHAGHTPTDERTDVTDVTDVRDEVGTTVVALTNGNGHGRSIKRRVSGKHYDEVVAHIAEVMAEVAAAGVESIERERAAELQAEVIFAYWASRLGHRGTYLDNKRKRFLTARLQENRGNVHELLFVVDGTKRDSHLMGRNDRNRKYDGIQTIFQDREHVERLSELGGYAPGILHPKAEKIAAIVSAAQ